MPPVPPLLLKARMAANAGRLYRRLIRLLDAFDLDDQKNFTVEQSLALASARDVIDQIQKPLPEDT